MKRSQIKAMKAKQNKKHERTVTVSIFGGKPETRTLCTKCNTLKFTGQNLIGHTQTYCGCNSGSTK